MEAKNIFDVQKFIVECNDMLTGKFFDLDKRLEKFLATMTKSEDILDFLATCLEGFDETEFDKAFAFDRKTGAVKVTLPSEDKKKLALFVTIFNDLTNGKLNSNQFLETYFQDGKLTTIQNFLGKVVLPFRDLLCKYFEISPNVSAMDLKKHLDEEQEAVQEEDEAVEEEESLPHLQELFQELIKNCNQILALLKFEKKRTDMLDDVEFVTNSIIKACERGDLMVVNGLVIGLNYISKKFRNIKHLVADMNDFILDYYDFLASETAQNEEALQE